MMKPEIDSFEDPQLAHLVRATLQTATQPTPGQLASLMPPAPSRRTLWGAWSRQWVALAASLLLLLGSLGAFYTQQQSWLPATTPTYLSVTATHTNTPTATVVDFGRDLFLQPRQTIAAAPAVEPVLRATPAPNPAPNIDN